jgi:hypothetical protein
LPVDQTEAPLKAKSRIPVIDARAVFTIEQARGTLQLAKNCLPREIRLGRLRVAKRAGKYLILGSWLLEWIEAGEVIRGKPPACPGPERSENHAAR